MIRLDSNLFAIYVAAPDMHGGTNKDLMTQDKHIRLQKYIYVYDVRQDEKRRKKYYKLRWKNIMTEAYASGAKYVLLNQHD